MKKIIISIIMLLTVEAAFSQTYEQVMSAIEQNNTTLKSLRAQADAQKLECRKDIHLDNPEVEFGYLWGSPADIGNRVDLNVTQSFDFPTTYYFKRKIAEGQGAQADLEFSVQRRKVLLEAAEQWTNLVYFNKLDKEYAFQLENAESLMAAYQRMFDAGEVGILELNKAKLNLLTVRKDYENNQIERTAALAELVRLNGGNAVVVSDVDYPAYVIPSEFSTWYASVENANPMLQSIELQQEINRYQVQLSKSLWAPKFTVGYNSERVLGTTLQGVGVGLSLPLWQNRYAVKSAKAELLALQSAEVDAKSHYASTMKIKYEQAISLQKLYADYQEIFATVNSDALLTKALENGQITLIEYLMERSVYREALRQALESERDMHLAICELRAYEH